MVREAVEVELTNRTGFPRRYACANGTAISKGTLLELTDPRTAITYSGNTVGAGAKPVAGICARDKEANDGETELTAWTNGIFESTASGAIALGASVMFLANNYIAQASGTSVSASGAMIAGYCLETASDNEVVAWRLAI